MKPTCKNFFMSVDFADFGYLICGGFENCVVEVQICVCSGVEISLLENFVYHLSVPSVLMVVYFLAGKSVCFSVSVGLRNYDFVFVECLRV